MTTASEAAPVRQREVLYFAGFDPRGARGYHRLYREQAALQAAAGGLALEVGPRQRDVSGFDHWQIRANTPSGEVLTHYRFMAWDDIVRQHWTRGFWRLLGQSLQANAFQARHGALWRAFKDRWPPVLAALMPVLLLMLVLVGIAVALAGWVRVAYEGADAWPYAAAGTGAALLAVFSAHVAARRFAAAWLTRSYAFNRRWARGEVPEMDQRIRQHAQALLAAAERLEGRADAELLIVGHSSGPVLAISALAFALRLRPDLAARLRVSLLTLGQCIPMFGALPHANSFQDDLRAVASGSGVDWLDFSAPSDGCCFALSDPLPACDVPRPLASDHRRTQPRLLSPRFADMFESGVYAALRRDKHRMHFQYLMAGARPVAYDYCQITAGDHGLAPRFADLPDGGDYPGLRPWVQRRRHTRG